MRVAGVFAFIFATYTVLMTFYGYAQIIGKAQVGDYSFQGGTQLKKDNSRELPRPDYATLYPGVFMSTALIGSIVVWASAWLVFSLVTSWWFIQQVWGWLYYPIIYLVLMQIVQQVLKRVVLDLLCMREGEIRRPRLFSLVWGFLIFINFILGIYAAISRLLMLAPFLILKFQRLDQSLLDEEYVLWDGGFGAFLTTVALAYEQQNPVRRSFIHVLMPQASRLYGPIEKKDSDQKAASPEGGERRYAKSLRNKLWLGSLLSRNPSLSQFRRPASDEERRSHVSGLGRPGPPRDPRTAGQLVPVH